MNTIYLVTWGLDKIDLVLTEGIQKYFSKLLKEEKKQFTVVLHDIKTLGETTYVDPCVIFGVEAKNYCTFNGKTWVLPSMKTMRLGAAACQQNKQKVFNTLISISKNIDKEVTVEPVELYVQTEEGVTMGSDNICDIQITEKEATHLKNIKNILNGGTMTITKGDITIKVA